ncbi:hypothetical protein LEP1GSC193_3859 [Leptospira alstonii serovar Pingchang str. 80-412]|uniref:Uncharacterized protein n=1 Tax=Leptospira alstonii serovar Pingchang str. 80-412 TaxID=1218564 RepID=T0G334_9LEPT|nr:hypothetical protein LEP1GSC193_3859 [Leptospira alstonii serovar Pingchang str. 80-412]
MKGIKKLHVIFGLFKEEIIESLFIPMPVRFSGKQEESVIWLFF